MPVVTEPLDLATLNAAFETQQPAQIVGWAAAQFGDDLLMSSSFGADSAVLLHMASTAMPGIRVIFVDTGYHFAETHEFRQRLTDRLKLNVLTYRTRNDPADYLRRAGETDPERRKDINACCGANKNEPFDRGMRELAPRAWLRGIRRSQSTDREKRLSLEWDTRHRCYAISPLINVSDRDIYLYLKQHDLPYHPLRDKGYWSIGCSPRSCTQPIDEGDHPRSGRWAGQNKFECGINVVNSLDSAGL